MQQHASEAAGLIQAAARWVASNTMALMMALGALLMIQGELDRGRSGIFIARMLRANGARPNTGQGSLFPGGVFVRSRHGGNERAVKVLLVGGGGREHALAWALAKAGSVDELVVAPGNPGIAEIARCVAVGLGDIDGLVGTAVTMAADLVVIGPEGPLVAGLADRLRALRIPVVGPSAAAARHGPARACRARPAAPRSG